MALRLVWPPPNSLWQLHLGGGLMSSVEGLSVGTVVDCSFECKEQNRRVSFCLPVNWRIEAKHKCTNEPPPGFQACMLLPRPSSWSKGGRTWEMPNEGPIKYSLQRQRPLGREKPPHTPPLATTTTVMLYMSRIFSKWMGEDLWRTHTQPPMNVQYLIFFPFFLPFPCLGLGFSVKTIWKWKGERRNRTTDSWAEYQWMYGESHRVTDKVLSRGEKNIRNESKGETKSWYEITTWLWKLHSELPNRSKCKRLTAKQIPASCSLGFECRTLRRSGRLSPHQVQSEPKMCWRDTFGPLEAVKLFQGHSFD